MLLLKNTGKLSKIRTSISSNFDMVAEIYLRAVQGGDIPVFQKKLFVLWNRGFLKVLNDLELILNES